MSSFSRINTKWFVNYVYKGYNIGVIYIIKTNRGKTNEKNDDHER